MKIVEQDMLYCSVCGLDTDAKDFVGGICRRCHENWLARVRNCTPHALVVHIGNDGDVLTIPPSGTVARVSVTDIDAPEVFGIPALRRSAGDVVDLPDPVDGVVYVVSALVADRVRRVDVVSPGPLVRDDAGQVIGCRGFYRSI